MSGDRDVFALGLKTVLVGGVGDGVRDSVGSDVLEGSGHGDGFVFGTGVHNLALLVVGDAVAGLISAQNREKERLNSR